MVHVDLKKKTKSNWMDAARIKMNFSTFTQKEEPKGLKGATSQAAACLYLPMHTQAYSHSRGSQCPLIH
jgi:hypothetical protein